jgi:hypothetical protein
MPGDFGVTLTTDDEHLMNVRRVSALAQVGAMQTTWTAPEDPRGATAVFT